MGGFFMPMINLLLALSIAYPIPEAECGHLAGIVEGFALVENPDAQLDIYLDADPGNLEKYVKAFDLSQSYLGTPAERGARANAECLLANRNPKVDV